MSFLLRPEGAEKCALRDLRRSEARPIHSGELAYVQGNTSRHLAGAGSRQSRAGRCFKMEEKITVARAVSEASC